MVCAKQGPDLVSDFGGGVSVADPSRLLDRLDNRPECQSLAVRRASAPEHLRLRTDRPQKLVHEARFADPRRPEERKELARFVGGRLFEGGPELPALAGSTNKRRIETLLVAGEARCDGEQPKGSRRSDPAERIDPARRLSVNRPPDEVMGSFAQQDLAGGCRLLESRGHVHGVAGHRGARTGPLGGDDLAGIDADSHRQEDAKLGLQAVVQRLQGVAHLERSSDGTKSIVLVDERHAKDGRDCITDDQLDRPAMPLENCPHLPEAEVQRLPPGFWIEGFVRESRSAHVRDERGDCAACVARTRDRRARPCRVLRHWISNPHGSRSGCEVQRRIVIKHGALQRFQFSSRINPQFAVEDLARLLVHVEGLGLPSRTVERQHQARVEDLAQRHFANEPSKVGDELQMTTTGELGIDPPFEGDGPKFVEPCTVSSSRVGSCEIRERGAAPQGERDRQGIGGGLRIANGECSGRLGKEGLEAPEIDVAFLGAQPVAVRLRLDAGDAECPTQARHVDPNRVPRTGGRIVAPDLIDEVVRRDGLADVQDKERENRPLQIAADLDAAAWSDDFERAQDLELHRRNRRIQSHPSPACLSLNER